MERGDGCQLIVPMTITKITFDLVTKGGPIKPKAFELWLLMVLAKVKARAKNVTVSEVEEKEKGN